jgi:hypothetical protein
MPFELDLSHIEVSVKVLVLRLIQRGTSARRSLTGGRFCFTGGGALKGSP